MAFIGGPVPTLAVKSSPLGQTLTRAAGIGGQLAARSLFQGAGQTFFSQAGQALAGNLASSAVNIAINPLLGGNITGPGGFNLNSGANILASTITPYVTGSIAAGINQNIQKSLQSAGPFGAVLSDIGTNIVNQVTQDITNSIFGGAVGETNYKMFPGGGGEPKADYGGSAYTLGDVVFSLQPAKQGPQAFGDEQATNIPKTPTTTGTGQVAGNSGSAQSTTGTAANTLKAEKMATASSGKTAYDKAILKFMSEGTPTSEAEIAKLSPEELTALNDTLNATDGQGLEALPQVGYPGSWTFITAPEDISWDVANKVDRVDIFGTNNPPIVAGSRGMRDLTLNNSLVEGFVRNVTVEGKIAALESLLNYGLNTTDGFVSVPVYQVWANNKSYGGSEAYYVIKDVKVKEEMRDLKGNATRAYVDISLMQVPAYQVNSGRDQASPTTSAAGEQIKADSVKEQAEQKVPGRGSSTSPKAPNAKPPSGPDSAKPSGRPPNKSTFDRKPIVNAPKPAPKIEKPKILRAAPVLL